MAYGFNNDKSKVDVLPTAGGTIDGDLEVGENLDVYGTLGIANDNIDVNGTEAYFLFKTNSIGSFTLPTGFTEAFALDTSTDILYRVYKVGSTTNKDKVRSYSSTAGPSWTVTEHANGLFVVEREFSRTIYGSEAEHPDWTAWGNVFYAPVTSAPTAYPITFASKPSIRLETVNEVGHEIMGLSLSNTSSPYTYLPQIYALCPVNDTRDLDITVKAIITGEKSV